MMINTNEPEKAPKAEPTHEAPDPELAKKPEHAPASAWGEGVWGELPWG